MPFGEGGGDYEEVSNMDPVFTGGQPFVLRGRPVPYVSIFVLDHSHWEHLSGTERTEVSWAR